MAARSKDKPYLGTLEVARLCDVCQRTVVMRCDKGLLPHTRIPGSDKRPGGHRRIHREDLVAFLRVHGFDNRIVEQVLDDGIDLDREVFMSL